MLATSELATMLGCPRHSTGRATIKAKSPLFQNTTKQSSLYEYIHVAPVLQRGWGQREEGGGRGEDRMY